MFHKLKNQSGFAFIELVLTTFVMSVGLVGGFILMNNSVSNSTVSDNNVVASQLANAKLEQIIADKTFDGYAAVDEADYPEEDLADPYDSFIRTVNIYEVDASDLVSVENGSGYKRVNVTVTWGEEDHESINVTTLLTEYGS